MLRFLVVAVLSLWATTSQAAFTRCGELQLQVRNVSGQDIDVIMFGDPRYSIPPGGSTAFVVADDAWFDGMRVTRRNSDLSTVWHDSRTSVIPIEHRACTLQWATL